LQPIPQSIFLKKLRIPILKVGIFYLLICLLSACSSQKDTTMSRGVQNLTARYNYIYNSNVILNSYVQQLLENYPDNYSEILPVYVAPEKFDPLAKEFLVPPSDSKELDQIMIKAQFIISDKSYSNYIDDAYLLLGKAQFYKGNYFIAAEYFDYTINNFKQNTANYLEGLDWKIRCLIQLNNLRAATPVLDSLSHGLENVRSDTSDPMATFAQMSIYLGRTKDAIGYLETAIKKTALKRNKLRWTFVLGQLYEKQKDYKQALDYYTKVQKSNAGFELYFNANLNRIKMNALLNGQKINRKQQLTYLLKDDKNTDYIDQIYFHIGESYADDANYKKAEDCYLLSAKSSTKNQYQKGLSFLKIAELNFKHFNNYVKAKTYYDSTINTLPKSYQGYETILKINQNLQYLTDRYAIIALQDTLQLIAKLPEEQRAPKLQSLFPDDKPTELVISSDQLLNNPFQSTSITEQANGTGTFYFSNTTAVSKGYSDFKKRWGNRKKQDNWRQSVRSSSQTNTQNVASLSPEGLPANPDQSTSRIPGNQALFKEYIALIPVTPDLLLTSNEKVLDAYFEIATFYQQELNDKEEANRIYQIILNRFPDNKYLAAIDYSLYLNYKTTDLAKSDIFKNLILSKFPASVYSQSILDPSFSLKQSALDVTANETYNDLFADYLKKDFYRVIKKVDSFTVLNPQNYLVAQFAYLKAISIGRTKQVDSLITSFNDIISCFPEDRLIVPLVKDHLDYITKHYADFKKRKVALTDFDPNEPRFFTQSKEREKALNSPVAIVQKDQLATIPEPVKSAEVTKAKPAIPVPPPTLGSVFSIAVSDTYYFVIDVADASLTLSSSRFGIGQFNRGTFPESNLKHQLVEFDDDQLIFVGNFSNFAEAKTYAERITPQFRQIMKMSPRIYKSFIISKENFDKLKNRDLLDQYVDFYKNNYQ
jgi:tetratricopeptide (TPR) repeat protein